jgi:chemotaxis family two-component system response regulator Rcp1
MYAAPNRPVDILLVEDNPVDADLMADALRESDWHNRVTLVDDGEEAVLYLRRHGRHAGAARPDLVLLDLFLPRKSGHEVLAEIKQDPELRLIPVIILTSADSEAVFTAAYDLHANCCVRKPTDLDEFAVTVKKIQRFWLQVASRPGGRPAFPPHHTRPEA